MVQKTHSSRPGNSVSVFIIVSKQKDASSEKHQAEEKMDRTQLNDDGEGGNGGWAREEENRDDRIRTGDEMRAAQNEGDSGGTADRPRTVKLQSNILTWRDSAFAEAVM